MKKGLLIFGGIICTFVCIVLFLLQIVFLTFNSFKALATRNSINEIVKNIDTIEILTDNKDDLYEAFEKLGFNKDETDTILNSNSFKEFVGNYIYDGLYNALNNKSITLEYNEIEDLVNKIETETNIKFKGKTLLLKIVKEKIPELEITNLSSELEKNIGPKTLSILKIALSNVVNVAFAVTFILMFLIMCLLRWSLYKPFIWYGITTAISSVIMFMAFYSLNVIELIKDKDLKKYITILKPIINITRNKGMIMSLITLGVGILMIVVYCLINKNKKENNNSSELLKSSEAL